MFYNPASVIQTMCHEIAHYVGQEARHRKKRAEHMMASISCFWLDLLPLVPAEKPPEEALNFIAPLANAMAEIVMKQYEVYISRNSALEDQEKFYLTSIGDFLASNDYLTKLMDNISFTDALRTAWKNKMDQQDPDYINYVIKTQQEGLGTDYIEKLYQDPKTKSAALDVLAGNMVISLQNKFLMWKYQGNTQLEGYFKLCQDILQAFSEAYADLRMVQLLNITDAQEYSQILDMNSSFSSGEFRTSFQFCLRRSAIRGFLGSTKEEDIFKGCSRTKWDNLTSRFCYDRLVAYLEICGKSFGTNGTNLNCLIHLFENSDAQELFHSIRENAISFRGDMISYCKQITNA